MVDINKNIKNIKSGDKFISAANFNKIVRSARRTLIGTNGINVSQVGSNLRISLDDKFTNNNWWLGRISEGEAGATVFTDENYQVRRSLVTSSDTASDLTYTDRLSPYSDLQVVTNLTEITGGTHLLSDSQQVVVFEIKDNGIPPVKRFVMSEDVSTATTSPTISVQASDNFIQVTSDGSGTFYIAHETSDAIRRIGCMTNNGCSRWFTIAGLELDAESHIINVGLFRSDTQTLVIWNHSDASLPT